MRWRRETGEGFGLYIRTAAGVEEAEEVVEAPRTGSALPLSWSPDGKYKVYFEQSGVNARLMAVSVVGDRQLFVVTDQCAGQAAISPNGKWVAYDAPVGANFQILITSFPEHKGRWQVSTKGAVSVGWSRTGKEILYIGTDLTLYSARVDEAAHEFRVMNEAALFRFTRAGVTQPFRIDPKMERIPNTAPMDPSTPITLLANWTSLTGRR